MKNDVLTANLAKEITEQLMPLFKDGITKNEVQNKVVQAIEKSKIKWINY